VLTARDPLVAYWSGAKASYVWVITSNTAAAGSRCEAKKNWSVTSRAIVIGRVTRDAPGKIKPASLRAVIVAPDIYRADFPEMVDIYDRPDNPVLVPETGFAPYYAPYVFTTLAGHNGLGFSPFGVDGGYNGSELTPGLAALKRTIECCARCSR
jgi:hypothetical protein